MEKQVDEMKQGLFITVEGTDGSGKTTQIGRISKYLSSLGYEVLLTREPGGTRISEKIRSIILDPEYTEMSGTAELLLYSASRAQLVEQVIRPSVEKGTMVICDRYIDSFYAYQGFGRGIRFELLQSITEIAIDGMMPDVTFFFDLDPEIGLARRMSATGKDRIENEKLEFHKKVHSGYRALAARSPARIRTIDAAQPADAVWKQVKGQLDSALGFVKLA